MDTTNSRPQPSRKIDNSAAYPWVEPVIWRQAWRGGEQVCGLMVRRPDTGKVTLCGKQGGLSERNHRRYLRSDPLGEIPATENVLCHCHYMQRLRLRKKKQQQQEETAEQEQEDDGAAAAAPLPPPKKKQRKQMSDKRVPARAASSLLDLGQDALATDAMDGLVMDGTVPLAYQVEVEMEGNFDLGGVEPSEAEDMQMRREMAADVLGTGMLFDEATKEQEIAEFASSLGVLMSGGSGGLMGHELALVTDDMSQLLALEREVHGHEFTAQETLDDVPGGAADHMDVSGLLLLNGSQQQPQSPPAPTTPSFPLTPSSPPEPLLTETQQQASPPAAAPSAMVVMLPSVSARTQLAQDVLRRVPHEREESLGAYSREERLRALYHRTLSSQETESSWRWRPGFDKTVDAVRNVGANSDDDEEREGEPATIDWNGSSKEVSERLTKLPTALAQRCGPQEMEALGSAIKQFYEDPSHDWQQTRRLQETTAMLLKAEPMLQQCAQSSETVLASLAAANWEQLGASGLTKLVTEGTSLSKALAEAELPSVAQLTAQRALMETCGTLLESINQFARAEGDPSPLRDDDPRTALAASGEEIETGRLIASLPDVAPLMTGLKELKDIDSALERHLLPRLAAVMKQREQAKEELLYQLHKLGCGAARRKLVLSEALTTRVTPERIALLQRWQVFAHSFEAELRNAQFLADDWLCLQACLQAKRLVALYVAERDQLQLAELTRGTIRRKRGADSSLKDSSDSKEQQHPLVCLRVAERLARDEEQPNRSALENLPAFTAFMHVLCLRQGKANISLQEATKRIRETRDKLESFFENASSLSSSSDVRLSKENVFAQLLPGFCEQALAELHDPVSLALFSERLHIGQGSNTVRLVARFRDEATFPMGGSVYANGTLSYARVPLARLPRLCFLVNAMMDAAQEHHHRVEFELPGEIAVFPEGYARVLLPERLSATSWCTAAAFFEEQDVVRDLVAAWDLVSRLLEVLALLQRRGVRVPSLPLDRILISRHHTERPISEYRLALRWFDPQQRDFQDSAWEPYPAGTPADMEPQLRLDLHAFLHRFLCFDSPRWQEEDLELLLEGSQPGPERQTGLRGEPEEPTGLSPAQLLAPFVAQGEEAFAAAFPTVDALLEHVRNVRVRLHASLERRFSSNRCSEGHMVLVATAAAAVADAPVQVASHLLDLGKLAKLRAHTQDLRCLQVSLAVPAKEERRALFFAALHGNSESWRLLAARCTRTHVQLLVQPERETASLTQRGIQRWFSVTDLPALLECMAPENSADATATRLDELLAQVLPSELCFGRELAAFHRPQTDVSADCLQLRAALDDATHRGLAPALNRLLEQVGGGQVPAVPQSSLLCGGLLLVTEFAHARFCVDPLLSILLRCNAASNEPLTSADTFACAIYSPEDGACLHSAISLGSAWSPSLALAGSDWKLCGVQKYMQEFYAPRASYAYTQKEQEEDGGYTYEGRPLLSALHGVFTADLLAWDLALVALCCYQAQVCGCMNVQLFSSSHDEAPFPAKRCHGALFAPRCRQRETLARFPLPNTRLAPPLQAALMMALEGGRPDVRVASLLRSSLSPRSPLAAALHAYGLQRTLDLSGGNRCPLGQRLWLPDRRKCLQQYYKYRKEHQAQALPELVLVLTRQLDFTAGGGTTMEVKLGGAGFLMQLRDLWGHTTPSVLETSLREEAAMTFLGREVSITVPTSTRTLQPYAEDGSVRMEPVVQELRDEANADGHGVVRDAWANAWQVLCGRNASCCAQENPCPSGAFQLFRRLDPAPGGSTCAVPNHALPSSAEQPLQVMRGVGLLLANLLNNAGYGLAPDKESLRKYSAHQQQWYMPLFVWQFLLASDDELSAWLAHTLGYAPVCVRPGDAHPLASVLNDCTCEDDAAAASPTPKPEEDEEKKEENSDGEAAKDRRKEAARIAKAKHWRIPMQRSNDDPIGQAQEQFTGGVGAVSRGPFFPQPREELLEHTMTLYDLLDSVPQHAESLLPLLFVSDEQFAEALRARGHEINWTRSHTLKSERPTHGVLQHGADAPVRFSVARRSRLLALLALDFDLDATATPQCFFPPSWRALREGFRAALTDRLNPRQHAGRFAATAGFFGKFLGPATVRDAMCPRESFTVEQLLGCFSLDREHDKHAVCLRQPLLSKNGCLFEVAGTGRHCVGSLFGQYVREHLLGGGGDKVLLRKFLRCCTGSELTPRPDAPQERIHLVFTRLLEEGRPLHVHSLPVVQACFRTIHLYPYAEVLPDGEGQILYTLLQAANAQSTFHLFPKTRDELLPWFASRMQLMMTEGFGNL